MEIKKRLELIDKYKGEETMFDVFFDFLIGVIDDAKKSLKKLNKIQRIIAVIFTVLR